MIVALLFLMAAFIVFFDLIQPAYGDLQAKKGRQLNDQNLLANERVTVDQAKKLLSQYESVNQAGGNVALAMPSGPNEANALAQLYGIAGNNSIGITNVSISQPSVVPRQNQAQANNASTSLSASRAVKPLGMLSIQVIANGSYENLKGFLAELESNIRIFDVVSLAVQTAPALPGAKSAAQDFFTYNASIVTYYQIP